MPIVYRITNMTNGKSYVGQTIRTLDQRWSAHLSAVKSGSKWRFHGALRKYGPDVWKREVIFESSDIEEVKNYEEKIILSEDLIDNKKGYNSKPGGCGGWIVKDENYDEWKQNLTRAVSGENNPRYLKETSNEKLLATMVEMSQMDGRIPSARRLREYGATIGLKVPKHFVKMRNFPGLIREVERITGLKYDPYWHVKQKRKRER